MLRIIVQIYFASSLWFGNEWEMQGTTWTCDEINHKGVLGSYSDRNKPWIVLNLIFGRNNWSGINRLPEKVFHQTNYILICLKFDKSNAIINRLRLEKSWKLWIKNSK